MLKKYVSFGNLEFEVLEGSVKITHQEGKSFKIQYKGKQVATLHDCPLNLNIFIGLTLQISPMVLIRDHRAFFSMEISARM